MLQRASRLELTGICASRPVHAPCALARRMPTTAAYVSQRMDASVHTLGNDGARPSRGPREASKDSPRVGCRRKFWGVGGLGGPVQATKYLASGWWQMMASVVCSGFSWNPSVTVTPMRSPPSNSTTLALSERSGQAG